MTRTLFSFAMAAAVAALLFAAPAQAKVTVGIGDQRAATFQNQLWQDLKLKKIRYLVPWDSAQNPAQITENDNFMAAARNAKQEVLVHFTAKRGCFMPTGEAEQIPAGGYLKTKACKAPTTKQYTTAVRSFINRYPYQKVFGVWNEANHISQPIYSKRGTGSGPKRNAAYYKALVKALKKAKRKRTKVVVADLLDSSNANRYAKSVTKALGRKFRNRNLIWGLHNYSDVNRPSRKGKGTIAFLKTVKGEVWVTETGGISIFRDSNLKATEKTAATAMKTMFKIANRYDSKRRGFKSRITRLYPYDFGPSAEGQRFDASFLRPNGDKRPIYDEFKKQARKAKR